MAGMGVGLTLVLLVFALVLAVAWIILPFALIGTKPLLQQLIKEQRRTNELLAGQAQGSREPFLAPPQPAGDYYSHKGQSPS